MRGTLYYMAKEFGELGDFRTKKEKEMDLICACCQAKLTEGKSKETHANLLVYMGVYSVKIEILKLGYVTNLCNACRRRIVSDAMALSDPYSGLILFDDDEKMQAKKREQRKSCPAYLLT